MVWGFVFGLAFFFRVVRAFSLEGFAVLGSVLGLSDFGGPRFFGTQMQHQQLFTLNP